jgi:hypothetical protein
MPFVKVTSTRAGVGPRRANGCERPKRLGERRPRAGGWLSEQRATPVSQHVFEESRIGRKLESPFAVRSFPLGNDGSVRRFIETFDPAACPHRRRSVLRGPPACCVLQRLDLGPSTECSINTDCTDPLVCVFKRCHAQCSATRDGPVASGASPPPTRSPVGPSARYASCPTKPRPLAGPPSAVRAERFDRGFAK